MQGQNIGYKRVLPIKILTGNFLILNWMKHFKILPVEKIEKDQD